MLFKYKAFDQQDIEKNGSIDAPNKEAAITSLQRLGLVVVSVEEAGEKFSLANLGSISIFNRVSTKDIVILSRQLATLFEAEISVLRAFQMLAGNSENPKLRTVLSQVADSIQGGEPISNSLAKHPKVFSAFYANMVRAGEESGKLSEVFSYMADYLDRQYELTSKTKNALIYPVFVVVAFVGVIIVMLTVVIPKLSKILLESGQDVPIYTKTVIAMSNFLLDYGIFLLIIFVFLLGYAWYISGQQRGRDYFDDLKLDIPYIGDLYQKLYLSRIADNMDTMLSAGISVVKTIEITASVVDNGRYEKMLLAAANDIKGGKAISDAFYIYKEIPTIMVQMMKVGEETGKLGYVLKSIAKFYKREVDNAVDTLVSLIEPLLIVGLGLAVAFLLTAVLLPIYNIAGSF